MKLGEIISKENKQLSKHGYTSETIMEEFTKVKIPTKGSNSNAVVNLKRRDSGVTIVFNPRNHKEYKELSKLKGIQLERLGKDFVVECSSKSYVINGQKNNHYIMESVDDGSVIKYDINDLKYDYKNGKVKIFESDEEYRDLGTEYGLPEDFFKSGRLFEFFPHTDNPLYFHVTAISEDKKMLKITYDKDNKRKKPYHVESTIVSVEGLAGMYKDGRMIIADVNDNYELPEDNGNWDEDV